MSRDLSADAREIFRAALDAVDPTRLLKAHLKLDGDALASGSRKFPLKPHARLVLVGAGKASATLAAAAEEILGNRLERGVVLAVEGTERPFRKLRCYACPHPIPDARSVQATKSLLETVHGLSADDLVLALWSGGGSSCLGLPVEGLTMAEVAETTRLLLAHHFQIQQVNQVRRVCLAAGDGGVARAAAPARVLAMVLCDAAMADVASGPTMPGAFALDSVIASLKNWDVWPKLPEAVRHRLSSLEGKDLRQAVDQDLRHRVFHVDIGDGSTAAEAAVRKARELGYEAEESEQPLQWEARMTGGMLAKRLQGMKGSGMFVAYGETTVAVKGKGRGGRNQETALAAALEMAGAKDAAILCGATDGVDGSSDAAGAVVTGRTCASAKDAQAARKALEDNDSHAFFADRPERIHTGPTFTNVADLAIGLTA